MMSDSIQSNQQSNDSSYGSIEKAISGDYEFSVFGVISEAWDKTSGAKWPIHLAFLFYFLVTIAIVVVAVIAITALSIGAVATDSTMPLLMQIVLQIVMNLIMLPMIMGIVMMGIKRSVDSPISSSSVFAYFSRMFMLLLTIIIMYIMVAIGFFLLIIPGIYLMVAYYMALPLVVEKQMGPWQALETSRKTINHCWFRMVGFMIVLSVVLTISMIPLGIGLIWSLPLFIIAYGIVYRNMFGVEPMTLEQ